MPNEDVAVEQKCPDCGGRVQLYYRGNRVGIGGCGEEILIPIRHYTQCIRCGWWWPLSSRGTVCAPPQFRELVLPEEGP